MLCLARSTTNQPFLPEPMQYKYLSGTQEASNQSLAFKQPLALLPANSIPIPPLSFSQTGWVSVCKNQSTASVNALILETVCVGRLHSGNSLGSLAMVQTTRQIITLWSHLYNARSSSAILIIAHQSDTRILIWFRKRNWFQNRFWIWIGLNWTGFRELRWLECPGATELKPLG